MVSQSGSTLRGVTNLHASPKDVEGQREPAVEETVDAAPDVVPQRLSWKTLMLIGGWVSLVLFGARAHVFSPEFWLSSEGLMVALQAVLPVVLALKARDFGDRLDQLSGQNEQLRDELVLFADPGPAGGNVVSIRHAVHKELAAFNEYLDRSLDRTSEIEGVIRREVETIEHTFAENERRMLGLVQELARQRETVVSATEQAREVVRGSRETLSQELASLASQVLEAGNYTRGIVEEVNLEIRSELAERSTEFAESLRRVLAVEIEPVNQMLRSQVESVDSLLSNGDGSLVAIFDAHGKTMVSSIEAAWERVSMDMTRQAQLSEELAGRLSGVIDQSLDSNVNRLENRVRATSLELLSVLDGAADQVAQRIADVGAGSAAAFDERVSVVQAQMDGQVSRLDDLLERYSTGFIPVMERHSQTLGKAIDLQQAFDRSTSAFGDALRQNAATFANDLAERLVSFESQLSDQSQTIGERLADRLDQAMAGLHDGSKRFETTLQSLQDTVSIASDKITIAVSGYNADFARGVDQLESIVSDGTDRLGEQLTRSVGDLGATLDGGSQAVESALKDWSRHIGQLVSENLTQSQSSFARQLASLEASQAEQGTQLQKVLGSAQDSLVALMETGAETLAATSVRTREELEAITVRFGTELQGLGSRFGSDTDAFFTSARAALIEAGSDTLGLLDARMTEITGSLHSRLQPIYDGLDARTRELEANIAQFGASLDTQSSRLHRIISQKSEAIEQNIEQGIGRFDTTMRLHLERAELVVGQFSEQEDQVFQRRMLALSGMLEDQSGKLAARYRLRADAARDQVRDLDGRITQFGTALEGRWDACGVPRRAHASSRPQRDCRSRPHRGLLGATCRRAGGSPAICRQGERQLRAQYRCARAHSGQPFGTARLRHAHARRRLHRQAFRRGPQIRAAGQTSHSLESLVGAHGDELHERLAGRRSTCTIG